MKRLISIIQFLLILLLGVSVVIAEGTSTQKYELEEDDQVQTLLPEKHLILNKDGSYGGSLDEAKYGKGAPLNGALDHPESGYWKINDYYNATSTESRMMIHNFRGYQQTMAYTDGLACTLMALNLFGYDTNRLYSEQRLLQRYEDANGTLDNDVTADGLQNMLSRMGIFSFTDTFNTSDRNNAGIVRWVKKCLSNNQIPLIAFWGENDYKWHAVIGADDLGDSDSANDVLILADPFDAFDHYQDGYRTLFISNLIRFWFDLEEDIVIKEGAEKESYSFRCENLVIQCPEGVVLDVEAGEETLLQNPEESIPEINCLMSWDLKEERYVHGGYLMDSDFSTPYGGRDWKFTSRADDYKSKLDTVYLKFNDYYNMKDAGTRVILENYRTKYQTSASTCGICSTLSALVYKGVKYDDLNRDLNDYTCTNEYKIMKQIERATGITVYNRGVANYEIAKILDAYGMTALHSKGYNMTNYLSGSASKVYPTIESMAKQLKKDLSDDNPFLIGWTSTGGHWQVIIGYDDMGTPEIYDDFCILADSSDGHDGLYDGYDCFSLMQVYNRWYNGSFHWNQQGLAIDNK